MNKPPRVAVILVAGWGSRMLPVTKSLAKPMLPIVNRPSLDYLITDYANAGIKEFIIVGKQHFPQVEEYLDRHLELEKMLADEGKDELLASITKFNQLKFTFVRQAFHTGTGGAIRSCLHLIPEGDPIIASYADVVTFPRTPAIEMLELYQEYGGTMIHVCEVPANETKDFGIAIVKQKVRENFYQIEGIVEKPAPEEAPSLFGLFSPMILCPEVIKILRALPEPKDKKDSLLLPHIMAEVAQKHLAYIYDSKGEILDTGLPAGYVKAQIRYAVENPKMKEGILEYMKNILATENKG
ncbi:MAG: NTP transferase domain-containing protein [Candidatus Abawacabacteria bacterium]|nr:NTP transferase domain-containing protein [Candidatus Abawacabacteria bacterium]